MLRAWWDSPALDTLQLSTYEYCATLNQLGIAAEEHEGPTKRRHARFRYWRRDVKVRIHRNVGTSTPYIVRSHNISAGGIAFLHGFFVQTDTRCDVALMTLTQRPTVFGGRVVRCRYLGGKTHELGVAFERSIDLRDYIPDYVAPADEEPTADELPHYGGAVLCIDESDVDRELTQFMAGELGVTAQGVRPDSAALRILSAQHFDAVLLKLHSGRGLQMAKAIREQGYSGYIVGVSMPGQGATEAEAVAQGCNAVLSTPITASRLADAFEGVLSKGSLFDEEGPTLLSLHWANVRMRPLILRYLERLDEHLRNLQAQLAIAHRDQLAQQCNEWSSSAEGYGFPQFCRGLRELEALVAGGMPLPQLGQKLDMLQRLCASARRVAE